MNLAVSKWDERFVSFRSPEKCLALEILEILWKFWYGYSRNQPLSESIRL